MNWIYFSIVTLLWGGSFIGIRFSLEAFPPFMAAAFRILLGAIFLAALGFAQRVPFPKSNAMIKKLCLVGIINFAIPWACLFWGEQYVQPAVASILNSTVPFFVFLFSWLMLPDEQPTWLRFAGVGLGFIGILFVFGPSALHFSADRQGVYGMLAVLGMAISYGYAAVWIKKLSTSLDVRWNIAIQGTSAFVFLAALSLLTEPQTWIHTVWDHPKAITAIFYLSFFSTAIAWLMFFRLIHSWGALRASAVTYVVPSVAVFVDWIYYGKLPTVAQLIGGALILSAIVLINISRKKKTKLPVQIAA